MRIRYLALLALAAWLGAAACGDDDERTSTTEQTGEEASAGDEKKSAPAAQPAAGQAEQPASGSTAAEAPSGSDPEREWEIQKHCEKYCQAECAAEQHDRGAYYQAKKAAIATAPFEVKIERLYLDGECGEGDKPEKRKDADGIRAIVEGELTYTGEDMLYRAAWDGSLYLRFGEDRYAEVGPRMREHRRYGRTKVVSEIEREVRGEDPWVSGQTREFHWESHELSPAFCEVLPDEAEVYLELVTRGITEGRRRHALSFVPVYWDEVVGMAVRKQVQVEVGRKEPELEPADAIYAKLDRILVTRLTGDTEWFDRDSVIQPDDYGRGPAAAFPVESTTSEWSVEVSAVSDAREFGGYAPDGEDEFLALVDLEIGYRGEEEGGSLSKLSARLETAPRHWEHPSKKAMGQIDLTGEVQSGGSVSGKLAFPRQRFERPFRLEVDTPDGETVYLDVFSYGIGPKRAPAGAGGE
ncbi:MAG: hypothetical protein R6V85_19260 [Polyangia bacterium]